MKANLQNIIGLAALTGTLVASLSSPARAAHVTRPSVPAQLEVEAGNEPFLVGHAFGTQNYVCRPSGSGVKFVLFTPQATLFNRDNDKQLITHFFSPNPAEPNTDPTVVSDHQIRATWQDSRDSSAVWAAATASATEVTDPAFVAKGAIAWLTLKMVGAEDGPTGGDRLSKTTFVQRVHTSGGDAPLTGCNSLTDVGNEAFEQYEADYFFYKKTDDHEADDSH